MPRKYEIYYSMYRDNLNKSHPHIIYYTDRLDEKNKDIIKIMENMCSKFPHVPCRSFHWSKRNLNGFEIEIESSHEILCFKERKQICKVDGFNINALENLFKTVFNDLYDNYSFEFFQRLSKKKLLNLNEQMVKYNIEHPAYDILSHSRQNVSTEQMIEDNQCKFQKIKQDSKCSFVKHISSSEVGNLINRRKKREKIITKNDTKIKVKDVKKSIRHIQHLSPLQHYSSQSELSYPQCYGNTLNKTINYFHSHNLTHVSVPNYFAQRSFNSIPWLKSDTFSNVSLQNFQLSSIPREYNYVPNNTMQSYTNNYGQNILKSPQSHISHNNSSTNIYHQKDSSSNSHRERSYF